MLEIRYNTETGEVTGWCGDEEQFGNLIARWGVEAVVILDIPIPDKPLDAWLFDTATQTLVPNPDYIDPMLPDPDAARVLEIIGTSPQVILMPEMWELLRIFARKLGYREE